VKRAAAGEDILIANHGKPVAMLTRLPRKHREMPWGIFEGKIHMTDDFDEPLEEFKDYM
jgi:antitoxin (DNA-binding transcriptional repressor) of toxin-antitoxin stability system